MAMLSTTEPLMDGLGGDQPAATQEIGLVIVVLKLDKA
ncbi:hypothetical protein D1AOALGA4SA_5385 [Olavius algarvensis Delta 1 endosymbiont]|nr:hypothetical protein D1AOALGA4SA_5385 [Olavius algarvensis Delta 1 endosymbiont]